MFGLLKMSPRSIIYLLQKITCQEDRITPRPLASRAVSILVCASPNRSYLDIRRLERPIESCVFILCIEFGLQGIGLLRNDSSSLVWSDKIIFKNIFSLNRPACLKSLVVFYSRKPVRAHCRLFYM